MAGCQGAGRPTPAPADGLTVYYVADWESGALDQMLAPFVFDAAGVTDPIAFAAGHLLSAPEGERLRSAFPAGMRVLSASLESGTLTVDLSAASAFSGAAVTVAGACAALTLCELPDVRALRLTVEGQPCPELDRVLTARDFVTDSLALRPVERQLTLYFVSAATSVLTRETRVVFIRENESAERYVVEELLGGPKLSGLLPLVGFDISPLSVRTEGGLCYVNLPAAFYDTEPEVPPELVLDAFVLSLTELPGVEAVQFQKDGASAFFYGSHSLFDPLPRPELS
ncbi:MAG: GerMN domain-containing protein [Oscillospiraceae bacterium]|nr:GerMN domain-containing protein [Oscillospiraceae bacterium]